MALDLYGWGTTPWGYGNVVRSSTDGPVVISIYPIDGQLDVQEDTFVTVKFFDPTYNLDTLSVIILVDGIQAYSGTTGFSAGFVGRVSYAAGVLTVRLRGTLGFDFLRNVNMSAYTRDLTDLYVIANWSFRIRADPNNYTGLSPLPVEVALQTPMERFISLEQYRTLFLDNALRLQAIASTQPGNKAARVIYQSAFATELCTLLNPYDLRNKDALDAVVSERQNTRAIDKVLADNSKTLKADIQAFHELSGLDTAYLASFSDYLDSTLYIYRVSLVANVLLYAKAYELMQSILIAESTPV